MVVNFRAREISRGTHKLARTPILIIIKKPARNKHRNEHCFKSQLNPLI